MLYQNELVQASKLVHEYICINNNNNLNYGQNVNMIPNLYYTIFLEISFNWTNYEIHFSIERRDVVLFRLTSSERCLDCWSERKEDSNHI